MRWCVLDRLRGEEKEEANGMLLRGVKVTQLLNNSPADSLSAVLYRVKQHLTGMQGMCPEHQQHRKESRGRCLCEQRQRAW